jgi:hypothetical protein
MKKQAKVEDFRKTRVYLKEIDGDGQISLEELRLLIPVLQEKYGKDAKVSFDAGHNNVSAMISKE